MSDVKAPPMSWCKKCLYPISSAVALSMDGEGICSGCRIHEQKKKASIGIEGLNC